MKRNIILIPALFSFVLSGAWERSEGEMSKIAADQLKLQSVALDAKAPLTKILDGDALSVYGSEKSGFVVVAKSLSVSPVIGYSDKAFPVSEMPDGLKWWLSQADRSLSAREGLHTVAATPAAAVEPIVKTAWGQDRPYNNLCPSTGGFWSANGQTGCVATAMAQVLKHFEYPVKGIGKGAYSTDGQNYKEVSISTTYKWDKMRDRYSFNYSDEEGNAVAELMRDCGYASRMMYLPEGSGANLYDAAYGLTHNLQYDSISMKIRTRDYYHESEWLDMVQKEISAGRPILYTGFDVEKMAHCFVFDGLDANGFVHVNWGWEGTANGYFDLSAIGGLNPSYLDPYTGSQIKYNFSDQQVMVYGFNPSSTPFEGAEYESFFGGIDIPELRFKDDSLLISTTPIFNFSHLDFKGLIGLVVEGEDGHAVVQPFFYSGWEGGRSIGVTEGLMYTEEYYPSATLLDSDGQTPRPDGKYRFYFVSWSEQEMAAGINPRMIHVPALFVEKDAPAYVVWEAEKKNGHWDDGVLRIASAPSGIDSVMEGEVSSAPDGVYTIDGRLIGNSVSTLSGLSKGTPVIVKKDGVASKMMTR